MPIHPLPVFEADADPRHRTELTDEERYAQLEPPKTMVVRFGRMKLIGEYPYGGDAKPGCGSKLVARTHRGLEVVEMLTTTCENAGCAKSITRNELLEYIENSGGRDYPFSNNGRVLRVATIEDLNAHSSLAGEAAQKLREARVLAREAGIDAKIVDVELILGGELITVYYVSEDRIDYRTLQQEVADRWETRIDFRQVGARDEARLVADYERCGQHCCCQNFLKVLKPISMRAAKMQKATLDPLKISGRCGRLMCCLRYEDQTYRELKANLPHRKTRVGTSEGPGVVMDSKILTQLVLVRLEHENREIAVPLEELMDPDECPIPGETPPEPDPLRGMTEAEVESRTNNEKRKRKRRRSSRQGQQDSYREKARSSSDEGADDASGMVEPSTGSTASAEPHDDETPGSGGKKRRRRRRRRGGGGSVGADGAEHDGPRAGADGATSGKPGPSSKKPRRRRRRGRGGGGGKRGGDGGGGGGNDGGPGGE